MYRPGFSDACFNGAEPWGLPFIQTLRRHELPAERVERISVAVLTGVTAAPLLTIPLVYLFRREDKNITPEVDVSRTGGYVGLRGEF